MGEKQERDFILYSDRLKETRGELPDCVTYEVSEKLRTQAAHLWSGVTGAPSYDVFSVDHDARMAGRFYATVRQILLQEYGVFYLAKEHTDPHEDLLCFFIGAASHDQALDVIELMTRMIIAQYSHKARHIVQQLNKRFLQHAAGYSFESGHIIRKDSEVLHEEVVRPVLHLLADPRFAGAEREYLEAHNHYRHGRHEDCLVSGLKAFESAMKTICEAKGWSYDKQKANASGLVKVLVKEIPLPGWMEAQLISVATVRNKLGGHGSGAKIRKVEPHYCTYHLHLAGTCIKFVVDAAPL